MPVSEKTTENSERLGQQAQPGIETGTSRLPVLSAEPLRHWWGEVTYRKYHLKHIEIQVFFDEIYIFV